MQLAFMVVLFCGLAYMFLTILRNQETMLRTLREDNARLSKRLFRLESLLAAQNNLSIPDMETGHSDGRSPALHEDQNIQSTSPGIGRGLADVREGSKFHGENLDRSTPHTSPVPFTLSSSPEKNLKKRFVAGLGLLSEKNCTQDPPLPEPVSQRAAQSGQSHDSQPEKLLLDWPVPASRKNSGSDGGMPELCP